MSFSSLRARPPLVWLLVAFLALAAGALVFRLEPVDTAAGGLRAAVALLVVLGVLFAATHLAKGLLKKLPSVMKEGATAIEVKGTKAIGSGRYLMIAEVTGERFLIASTKEGVSLLARLSREGEKAGEKEALDI